MDDTKTREKHKVFGHSETSEEGKGAEGREGGSAKRITIRCGGPCMPMRV